MSARRHVTLLWPGAAFISVPGSSGACSCTSRWTEPFCTALLPTLALATAALGWSSRTAKRILQSPLRSFTTIHPLYLLRAKGTTLEVYPLFNLVDLKATHQHTNGVYTQTTIELRFGAKRVRLSVRGKEHAEAWLRHLVELRGRSLELLGEGFLEAEPGIDLLPPALLTDPDAAPLSQWGRAAPASRAAEGPVPSIASRAQATPPRNAAAPALYGAFAGGGARRRRVGGHRSRCPSSRPSAMPWRKGEEEPTGLVAARYPDSRFLPENAQARAGGLEGLHVSLGDQTLEQAPRPLRREVAPPVPHPEHPVALRVEVDSRPPPRPPPSLRADDGAHPQRGGRLLAASSDHARLTASSRGGRAAPEKALRRAPIRATVRPETSEGPGRRRRRCGGAAQGAERAWERAWPWREPPSSSWTHTSPVLDASLQRGSAPTPPTASGRHRGRALRPRAGRRARARLAGGRRPLRAQGRRAGERPVSSEHRSTDPYRAAPAGAAAQSQRGAHARLHLLRGDAFPLVLTALLAIGGLAVLWWGGGADCALRQRLRGPCPSMSTAAPRGPRGGRAEKRLDFGLHQVRVTL